MRNGLNWIVAPLRPVHGPDVEPRVLPKFSCGCDRIELDGLPPRSLFAPTMQVAVVNSAERDREFVADPAPHRSRLHEPQMVSVRRLPSA